MDAIELLKADHKKVRGLLTELEKTTSRATKTRTDLLSQIKMEIEIHSAIEEEIFYPAFDSAAQTEDDRRMIPEALAEHKAAGEVTLPDLLASDVNSAPRDQQEPPFPGAPWREETFPFPLHLHDARSSLLELSSARQTRSRRKAELTAQAAMPRA